MLTGILDKYIKIMEDLSSMERQTVPIEVFRDFLTECRDAMQVKDEQAIVSVVQDMPDGRCNCIIYLSTLGDT